MRVSADGGGSRSVQRAVSRTLHACSGCGVRQNQSISPRLSPVWTEARRRAPTLTQREPPGSVGLAVTSGGGLMSK